MDEPVVVLAGIVVLGVGSEWLAWALRLPSILVLLAVGILAGPVTGVLDPDGTFGSLLFPFVSLSVALILYEGGLGLRVSELRKVGATVRNLVSAGLLVTWGAGTGAAALLLGFDLPLAALLGAVLVVTGPTVIQPLLRQVRPSGDTGRILRWEGIVIDPIGALLALLVFQGIFPEAGGGLRGAPAHAAAAVARTVLFGGGLGLLGAGILVLILRRFWVPDSLESPVSLMLALGVVTASNAFQEESGLFAATLMGIVVANQRITDVENIIEFKENLRVLLISSLFILLGARLDLGDLRAVGLGGLAFLAVLVVVARPLGVWLSTLRSGLRPGERLFLAWLAPRGIVAAAVASVFALRLEQIGYEGAHLLAPVTFAVILGTVAIYGLTARPLAIRLGLAERDPDGVLLLGADRFSLALAECLRSLGKRVLLVDANRARLAPARMAGIRTHPGSVLAETFLDSVDLGGIGRLLALTPNDWVNGAAVRRLGRVLGEANAYRLSPPRETSGDDVAPGIVAGRPLFEEGLSYADLYRRMAAGGEVKATPLTETFDHAAFLERHDGRALPLFVLSASGRLEVVAANDRREPSPGETLVSLVGGDEA